MLATPLAVWAGLKEPQVLAGVQLQVTPAFAESLATVAVMATVWLVLKEVGTVPSVTVMAGVGEGEGVALLLHATHAAMMLKPITTKIDLRNVIAHLPSIQSRTSLRSWNAPCEASAHQPEIRSHCAP